MQKVNLFETDRMFTDIYCLEPGQEQRAHAHTNADKVYVVIEGIARVLVGTEECDVEAGSAVLAQAGIEHGVRNSTENRLVLLVFMAPNPNRD
jgi:mannose-6-phosphate isomerase-like protein (cupin superfamily)